MVHLEDRLMIAQDLFHLVSLGGVVFFDGGEVWGRGRYFGNIRIAAQAHGSEASLRDDTLLIGKDAKIDAIPALEIAANDVKAFHGATVGAIDEEHIFYLMSRGIERDAAEKLIALGFFEPAVSRFPGEGLRAELRALLEEKLAGARR